MSMASAPTDSAPGALAPPGAGGGEGPVALFEADAAGELSAQRDAPVGGQAVLEGVMMRGVSNWAVAVRKPTAEQLAESHRSPEEAALGEIEVKAFPLDSAMRRHRVLRLPIIRGVVALGGSLAIGFKALEISANAQLVEDPAAGGDDAPANGAAPPANGADPANSTDLAAHGTGPAANGTGPAANGADPVGTAAIAVNGAAPASNGAGPNAKAKSGVDGGEEIPRAVWLGTIVV